MPDEKPLFVPLCAEPFDRFESGEKKVEVRQYGRQWNARTVRPGRAVVLSRGYGKHRRLRRVVGRVAVVDRLADLPSWATAGARIRDPHLYFDPARPLIAFEAT